MEQNDWESCGKGFLKFYQLENQRLNEVKTVDQLNKNLTNLFLIVDSQEIKDNSSEDLSSALKYKSILKSYQH